MGLLNEGKGYGQVEPNHLSAQRTGQIYAQLPCDAAIKQLQNGQFLKYDYAEGKCKYNGNGESMLVFNEVKLYDPKHSYKDFVYDVRQFTDKQLYPRLLKTNIGDIMTLNLVSLTTEHGNSKGVKLGVDSTTGILTEGATSTDGQEWIIVKAYTMADGSPAVKVQRIA